jgi:hypothetical protein
MSCEGRIPTTAKNLTANNNAMHMRVSQQDRHATGISQVSILITCRILTSRYEHSRDVLRFEAKTLAGDAPFLHLCAAISTTPGYVRPENSHICEPSEVCVIKSCVLDAVKTPPLQDARLS